MATLDGSAGTSTTFYVGSGIAANILGGVDGNDTLVATAGVQSQMVLSNGLLNITMSGVTLQDTFQNIFNANLTVGDNGSIDAAGFTGIVANATAINDATLVTAINPSFTSGSFGVTLSNGSVVQVNLNSYMTLANVISTINATQSLSAVLNPTSTGLILTINDQTGGSGPVSISVDANATVLSALGLDANLGTPTLVDGNNIYTLAHSSAPYTINGANISGALVIENGGNNVTLTGGLDINVFNPGTGSNTVNIVSGSLANMMSASYSGNLTLTDSLLTSDDGTSLHTVINNPGSALLAVNLSVAADPNNPAALLPGNVTLNASAFTGTTTLFNGAAPVTGYGYQATLDGSIGGSTYVVNLAGNTGGTLVTVNNPTHGAANAIYTVQTTGLSGTGVVTNPDLVKTLNGMKIGNQTGGILVSLNFGDTVKLTNSQFSDPGLNLQISAFNIILDKFNLSTGYDPSLPSSTGNSAGGALTLLGNNIVITNGSILNTTGSLGSANSGNITIDAFNGFNPWKLLALGFARVNTFSTHIDITGTGTLIEGGSVAIQSIANSQAVDNSGVGLLEKVGAFLTNFGVLGAANYTSAKTAVHIGSGTTIDCTNLTVTATATSKVEPRVLPAGLGIGISVSIEIATADVELAGTVNATGNVVVNATVNNIVKVGLLVPSEGRSFAFAIGVADVLSHATAEIAASAVLNVGTLSVTALTANYFIMNIQSNAPVPLLNVAGDAAATNALAGAAAAANAQSVGKAALSIGIDLENSSTTAHIDGKVTAVKWVTVSAQLFRTAPINQAPSPAAQLSQMLTSGINRTDAFLVLGLNYVTNLGVGVNLNPFVTSEVGIVVGEDIASFFSTFASTRVPAVGGGGINVVATVGGLPASLTRNSVTNGFAKFTQNSLFNMAVLAVGKIKAKLSGPGSPATPVDLASATTSQGAVAIAFRQIDETVQAGIGNGTDQALVEAGGAVTVTANVNSPAIIHAGSSVTTPVDPVSKVATGKVGASFALSYSNITNIVNADIAGNSQVDSGAALLVQGVNITAGGLALTPTANNGYTFNPQNLPFVKQLFTPLIPPNAQDSNPASILLSPYAPTRTHLAGSQGIVTFLQSDTPTVVDNAGGVQLGDTVLIKDSNGTQIIYEYIGVDGNWQQSLASTDYTDLKNWTSGGNTARGTPLGLLWAIMVSRFVVNGTSLLLDGGNGVANLLNSNVSATSLGQKLAVAGMLTVQFENDNVKAVIRSGAQINQNTNYRSGTGSQTVEVEAQGGNEALNAGGNVQLPSIGSALTELLGAATAQGSAAGATGLIYNTIKNTDATIESNVTLYADSLYVNANSLEMNLMFGASGSAAPNVGINGVVVVNTVDDHTHASIGTGASIVVGNDLVHDDTNTPLAGSTIVSATDTAYLVGVAGAYAAGSQAGVGLSAMTNNVSRNTEAFIGSVAPDISLPGTDHKGQVTGALTSGGAIVIDARNTGFITSLAVAGSKVSEAPPSVASLAGDGPAVPAAALPNPANNVNAGTSGLGISGAASVVINGDTARAYIYDASSINDGGALTLQATNSTNDFSISGALSIAVVKTPGSNNTALAGAFSVNVLSGNTDAFINDVAAGVGNSAAISAASIDLNASRSGTLIAIAAGGAGASGIDSHDTAVAGSVTANYTSYGVGTELANTSVDSTGSVKLDASDTGATVAIAGAASYGGNSGYGAAISVNTLNNTVTSSVDQISTLVIDPHGEFSVTAENTPTTVTIAGSVGIGEDGTGAAGTVSVNILTNTVSATVNNTNQILSPTATLTGSALSSATIEATDQSTLVNIAGAVGVGLDGSNGFGVAVGVNIMTDKVTAALTDSNLNVNGDVTVKAISPATIGGVAIGVAVSAGGVEDTGGTSIGGSLQYNELNNTVVADISTTTTGQSTVIAGGNITVSAIESSELVALTGAVGVSLSGNVGFGASLSFNEVADTVDAYINDSTVSSTRGDIEVTAESSPLLVSIAAAGAAGKDVGFGGAFTINSITNTVDAHIAQNAIVATADGSVLVQASEAGALDSVALAVGVGTEGTGIGAVLAYNFIGGNNSANPNVLKSGHTSLPPGSDGAPSGATMATVSVNDASNTAISGVTAYIDNATVTAQNGNIIVESGLLNPLTSGAAASPVNAQSLMVDPVTDVAGNVITSASDLSTGQAVVYHQGADGSAIGGLVDGQTYFVVNEGTSNGITSFGLVASYNAAMASDAAGNTLALTSVTGNAVQLTVLPSSATVGNIQVALPRSLNGQIVSVTGAGGGGDRAGLAGAISINFIREDITTTISNSPSVSASGNVALIATDAVQTNSAAGTLTLSGTSAAVNGSVGVNDIADHVSTKISNAQVTSSVGNVALAATEQARIVSLVVGGGGSGTGLAIGGSLAVNSIANQVSAQINTNAVVHAYGDIDVIATDSAVIGTLAGNVDISLGGSAAAGLAFAVNTMTDEVSAIIDHSSVNALTGNLLVDATFSPPTNNLAGLDSQIASMAVAGAATGGSFAGVGAVTLNWISNDVQAAVQNISASQQVTAGTELSVQAGDSASIESLAGALSFAGLKSAGSSAAVGASVSYNYIGGDPNHTASTQTNSVTAQLQNDAGLIQAGQINVDAGNTASIGNVTVAGAAAVGKGTAFALGGAVSINRAADTTNAKISGAQHVSGIGSGGITINAHDTPTIEAFAGGVGLALVPVPGSSIAAGVSVAINEIKDITEASISADSATVVPEDSALIAAGPVRVVSIAQGNIEAITFGVAAAVSTSDASALSGAGAGSSNTLDSTVTASIDSGSNLTTSAGDVTVSATNTTTILAGAGALSFSGSFSGGNDSSVGVSDTINQINNTTVAEVNASQITSAQGVKVNAVDTSTIDADTAGGAIIVNVGGDGLTLAVGVSLAHNLVNDSVSATIDHGSNIIAGTNVSVAATQSETIQAVVISATISVSASDGGTNVALAGGGARANNELLTQTDAKIKSGSITATGGTPGSSSAGNINVTASGEETITAVVLSVTGALSANKDGAVAIGASQAQNLIGYSTENAGTPVQPGAGSEVSATVLDATITTENNLTVQATGNEIITATVAAGTVAVVLSEDAGFGAAGAGSNTTNAIAVNVVAAVQDDSQSHNGTILSAGSLDIIATDTPTITATAATAALGVALTGKLAIAAAIGVGLAENQIADQSSAQLMGVAHANINGPVEISSSVGGKITANAAAASLALGVSGAGAALAVAGGGAAAINIIDTNSIADISNSDLSSAGSCVISAIDNATVTALIISASASLSGTGGSSAGAVSLGAAIARNQIGNGATAPALIKAYTANSSVSASGALTLLAKATETITDNVGAGSAALAGSSGLGVGLAGAGASDQNEVNTDIEAYVEGAPQISASTLTIKASDDPVIYSTVVGAALAGASSGGAAISGAIGVALSENIISDKVSAFVDNSSSVIIAGDVTITALETAHVTADAVATTLAVALSELAVTLSGAGADATNIINNSVSAYISNSKVQATTGAHDLTVAASNTATITALVGGVAASGSIGTGAVAGAVGGAVAYNLIGVADPKVDLSSGASNNNLSNTTPLTLLGANTAGNATLQNQTLAYVSNSVVQASGKLLVDAFSSETMTSDAFAGAIAIAVGVGGAAAGSGVGSIQLFSTDTEAHIQQSSAQAGDSIDVSAIDQSEVNHATAISASISAVAGVALAIAASTVTNNIANQVVAGISGDAGDAIQAGQGITVQANTGTNGTGYTKIDRVNAVAASLAVGIYSASGGGVAVTNAIANTVQAGISGALDVVAAGDVGVYAQDNATENAKLDTVVASVSLSIGVELVSSTIGGSVDSSISAAQVSATDIYVTSTTNEDIASNQAFGLAAAIAAVNGSNATGSITTTVTATIDSGAVLDASDQVMVQNNVNNTVNANTTGIVIGGVAIGAMTADANLGNGHFNDVVAQIDGVGTRIHATAVSVISNATDYANATSLAGAGGGLTVIGAQTTTVTTETTEAKISGGAQIVANGLVVQSLHNQNLDASADGYAAGALVGAGAGIKNIYNSEALVTIAGALVYANNIAIVANNTVTKDRYLNGNNLKTGSGSAANETALVSATTVGTKALVTIGDASGDATMINAVGNFSSPATLTIDAKNIATLVDNAWSLSVSGWGLTQAIDRISGTQQSQINVANATLTNQSGDLVLGTKETTLANPSTDLSLYSFFEGLGVSKTVADIADSNQINLNNANLKANNVTLRAGVDSTGVPDVITASSYGTILTVSLLPSIAIPLVNAHTSETNTININAGSNIDALQNIYLTALKASGTIVKTSGEVASLSGIPYGFPVPDGASTSSTNTVTIAPSASLLAGANNQSNMLIIPASQAQLAGVTLPVEGTPVALTADQILLITASLNLSTPIDTANTQYQLAALSTSDIPFAVVAGTVVEDVTSGQYYQYIAPTSGSTLMLLNHVNYSDTSTWRLDSNPADQNDAIASNFSATQVAPSLLGKFYVVLPAGTTLPVIAFENQTNLLAAQIAELQAWSASHSTDVAAVARYQVQIDTLTAQMVNLGLSSDPDLTTGVVAAASVDILTVIVPSLAASAGSIFIASDQLAGAYTGDHLRANNTAAINLVNDTALEMIVQDTVIENGTVIGVVNGQYLSLAPGHVYVNDLLVNSLNQASAGSASSSDAINITQENAGGWPSFQFPGASTASQSNGLPQALFITGTVNNAIGAISIVNNLGDINISGTLDATTVTINAAGNFSLNTQGWLDIGGSPTLWNSGFSQQNAIEVANYNKPNNTLPGMTTTTVAQLVPNTTGAIFSQGAVEISAQFIDVNGRIQSGAQALDLTIASSFAPTSNTALVNSAGVAVAGISFGNDTANPTAADYVAPIPVSGYFDASTRQIVINPMKPLGGSITLAGQILSVGQGNLVVADGYAAVNITNQSNVALNISGIDNSTNRVGTITIINTTNTVNPEKTVYTYQVNNGQQQVKEIDYLGTETNITINGETVPVISYAVTKSNPPVNLVNGAPTLSYAPLAGQYYTWVNGQSKTVTTVTEYWTSDFNLLGEKVTGGLLSNSGANHSAPTIVYNNATPLLQSQGVVYAAGSAAYTVEQGQLSSTALAAVTAPAAATAQGVGYWGEYFVSNDQTTPVFNNVTTVQFFDNNAATKDPIYLYIGPNSTNGNPTRLNLSTIADYSKDPNWQLDSSATVAQYQSTWQNASTTAYTWTTGGGWLRTKTVHQLITQVQGEEDYYTSTLPASQAIGITFLAGSTQPDVSVTSNADIHFNGIVKVAAGGAFDVTTIATPGNPAPVITMSQNAAVLASDAGVPLPINISAAGSVQLQIQGSSSPVSISTHDADITLTAVSPDNAHSSIVVKSVIAGKGNVTINATDGITAVDSTSIIEGNVIELTATAGAIGTSNQAVLIASDTLGNGGFAALDQHDIHVDQVHITAATATGSLVPNHANLVLLTPTDSVILDAQGTLASVRSTSGDVTLQSNDGDILDGTKAVFSEPTNPKGTSGFSAAQLTAIQYPIAADIVNRALLPGNTNTGAGAQSITTSSGLVNVVGVGVHLIAADTGSIGATSATMTLNFIQSGDGASLSLDDQKLLSPATLSDIIGVQHATYIYQGASNNGFPTYPDFSDPLLWKAITINATSSTSQTSGSANIEQNGYVLNDVAQDYGLYQYVGTTTLTDLINQNFKDATRWTLLTPTLLTPAEASTGPLTNGMLVADGNAPQSVTFALKDSVKVAATGNVSASAGSIALSSAQTITVGTIEATGGQVYLSTTGPGAAILDSGTALAQAIKASASIDLSSAAGIGTSAVPLRLTPGGTSDLSVVANNDVHIEEVGPATTQGQVIISNAGAVNVLVDHGDLLAAHINAYTDVNLTNSDGNLLSAYSQSSPAPVVASSTGNIDLQSLAGGIGSADNYLVISDGVGSLTADAHSSIYLHAWGQSSLSLNNVTATAGNVNIVADASLNSANAAGVTSTNINALSVNLIAMNGGLGVTGPLYTNIAGILNASAYGNINIVQNGLGNAPFSGSLDLTLGNVKSTNGDVMLATADGNIDAGTEAGTILVNKGNINLNATQGGIIVGTLIASQGNASLSATGDITAVNSSAIIEANQIDLESGSGAIGSTSQAVLIASNTLGNGGFAARAQGAIDVDQVHITTPTGNLVPNDADLYLIAPLAGLIQNAKASVQSDSSVTLQSLDGSILNGLLAGSALVNVMAASADLLAPHGNIGALATSSAAQDSVTVAVSGALSARATNIVLASPQTVTLGALVATDQVVLTTTQPGASLLDSRTAAAGAIQALGNITLDVQGGIGSTTTALTIKAGTSSLLDAVANNDVNIEELGSGTTQGQVIQSHAGAVTVTVDSAALFAKTLSAYTDVTITTLVGSILNADNNAPVVTSSTGNIDLNSADSIGLASNALTVADGVGSLSASAKNNIVLHAVGQDSLRLNKVTSVAGAVTIVADQSLNSANPAGVTTTNISATDVSLSATNGGLGLTGPLYTAITGKLAASADGNIDLVQNPGLDLKLAQVQSLRGDVTLRAAGGAIIDTHSLPIAVLGNTLNLSASTGVGSLTNRVVVKGAVLNASATDDIAIAAVAALQLGQVISSGGNIAVAERQSDLSLASGALVSALSGTVTLLADHAITTEAGSLITSGQGNSIESGTDDSGMQTGLASMINIHGALNAPWNLITGGSGADILTLNPTALVGWTRVLGNQPGQAGGNDTIIVDRLPSMTVNGVLTSHLRPGGSSAVPDTVDLDGQGNNTNYIINTTGNGTDYIINVNNTASATGAPSNLTINGTAAGDNTFLLRSKFVALLTVSGSGYLSGVERINYNTTITGALTINGKTGNDHFYLDDNSAQTIINGGTGSDTFQIGQLFGTQPLPPNDGIANGDGINTVQTINGYLSRGISYATIIHGGQGEDTFVDYSNGAPLTMVGAAGADTFIIHAFKLVNSNAVSTSGTTVLGGSGNANIEYNVDAPVSITGGTGLNTVKVIGSGTGDNFVITADTIEGAGVDVSLTNIQSLEVDALGGNNNFYVLSTNANTVTTLIGGPGSNNFSIAGDVTTPIVNGSLPNPLFGSQPHQVSAIAGPLVIEGNTIAAQNTALTLAVMLPTENPGVLPVIAPTADPAKATNTLTVFNDGSISNDVGVLGPVSSTGLAALQQLYGSSLQGSDFGNISGLNMGDVAGLTLNFGAVAAPLLKTFDTGITFHDIQIVDVLLGQGNDTFTVNSTTSGTITAIQGGGGNNTLIANGGGGAASPLLLFGSTSQNGQYYSSTPTTINGHADQFFNAGNNTIDASQDPYAVIIEGGPGNDTIHGSQGNDIIAGGGGSNNIVGGAGDNVIYGNAGLNIDLSTRLSLADPNLLTVTLVPASTDIPGSSDPLLSGNNNIRAGNGNNTVFANGGVLVQSPGTMSLVSNANMISAYNNSGNVTATNTVTLGVGKNTVFGSGLSDTITASGGNDIVLGNNGIVNWTSTGVLTDIKSSAVSNPAGVNPTVIIALGDGSSYIIGGIGNHIISVGTGESTIIANNGEIDFTGGVVTRVFSTDTSAASGGNNQISAGDGSKTVIGGTGSVSMALGSGSHYVLGHQGTVVFSASGVPISVQSAEPTLGGNVTATFGDGNTVAIGGAGSNTLTAGNAPDRSVLLGHNGIVTFDSNGHIASVTSTDPLVGGNVKLTTGGGNNILISGHGNDQLISGNGNDVLIGGGGLVKLVNDQVILAETIDLYDGGNNFLNGGGGLNIMFGGSGHNTLVGSLSNNIMSGNFGAVSFDLHGKVTEFTRFGQALNSPDLMARAQEELFNFVMPPSTVSADLETIIDAAQSLSSEDSQPITMETLQLSTWDPPFVSQDADAFSADCAPTEATDSHAPQDCSDDLRHPAAPADPAAPIEISPALGSQLQRLWIQTSAGNWEESAAAAPLRGLLRLEPQAQASQMILPSAELRSTAWFDQVAIETQSASLRLPPERVLWSTTEATALSLTD